MFDALADIPFFLKKIRYEIRNCFLFLPGTLITMVMDTPRGVSSALNLTNHPVYRKKQDTSD